MTSLFGLVVLFLEEEMRRFEMIAVRDENGGVAKHSSSQHTFVSQRVEHVGQVLAGGVL